MSIEHREYGFGTGYVVRWKEQGRKSRSRTFRDLDEAVAFQATVGKRARPFPVPFWEKVDVRGPGECWLWTGASDGRYGATHFPVLGRTEKAHRVAWFLSHGELVPDDLTVDHLCLTTLCVNPAHLRLLTRAENSSRARRSGV